jgi:hypothetical protein
MPEWRKIFEEEDSENSLDGFADELEEEKFILDTFSELADGHKDALQIRTLSSSGLLVYLAASASFGAIIATVVDFVVGKYKNILEISAVPRKSE